MRVPQYKNPVYREAVAEQERLKQNSRRSLLPAPVRLVAGADVPCALHERTFWGGLVVCEASGDFRVVDSAVVKMEVDFPYIPGLLGFREVPVLAAAYERLALKPDVTLVDAHGLAHPRGFGSACHVGVLLDIATVGCAKSLLCGEFRPARFGERKPCPHPIGGAVRGGRRCGPAKVSSPCTFPPAESDLEIGGPAIGPGCALRATESPRPVRQAHRLVNEASGRGG